MVGAAVIGGAVYCYQNYPEVQDLFTTTFKGKPHYLFTYIPYHCITNVNVCIYILVYYMVIYCVIDLCVGMALLKTVMLQVH